MYFRTFLWITLFFLIKGNSLSAQVRIRIFANQSPESAIFSVTAGEYELITFSGNNWIVKSGTLVAISKFKERLAVKVMNDNTVVCDSVLLAGRTGRDIFSLRIFGNTPLRQTYSGDLQCLPDLNTLMFINICDIESYIAGVVKSEGGSGKNPEYFKTQAVIARTYMYRYMEKHAADHFNLCDNTHCQAFNGLTGDSMIIKAALDTRGELILGPDTLPIIAAFHSNCGGETAPSEDVWLTPQPYLKKVTDPHCLASRNAKWSLTRNIDEWTEYLKKSGFTGDASLLNFSQITRSTDYKAGTFSLPLRQIRNDFNLRSTFFSVSVAGDSVIFKGRGYGHGVGLCQEGAMEMAAKGFNYRQIIGFYYTNVRIITINPLIPLKGD
ncbi:MAG: SpoIID/LytB domain-containing protein [Bacteroidales bacterium]|jgi:stage II sporulation protein D|nr:SpoIID/LytB domain-containing protein [Bacteroidales bacterium]